jgi:hypothetical protein
MIRYSHVSVTYIVLTATANRWVYQLIVTYGPIFFCIAGSYVSKTCSLSSTPNAAAIDVSSAACH